MESTTIRIGVGLHAELKELAKQMNLSIQVVLKNAISDYQDKLYWQRMDAAYERLHGDLLLSQKIDKEDLEWDVTLNDGFDEKFSN